MSTRIKLTSLAVAVAALWTMSPGTAKVPLHTPDGRVLHLKGGTAQPDLSRFRSRLESKVVDHRFYTNQNAYLANEAYSTSQTGFNDMVKAGIPLAYKPEFHWVTHQGMYWHARYLLQWSGAASRLGISMVQGPYWTVKALEFSKKNRFGRDRGERTLSNKDVLMGIYLPLFYDRTGFPRVFDSAFPTYLQYASGDPRLVGPVIVDDDFNDPQSEKEGSWGAPRYFLDWTNLRWDHDRMDTTFDMGGIAQFLKRRAQWTGYMFHSTHVGQSPSDPNGEEITLLGNDAEEGFRGTVLASMAINTMLEVKACFFADEKGKKLGGLQPFEYDPSEGLRYIPHTIKPNILWVGDLPERLWSMEIEDNSSQLWDQASWIWATTEFSHFVLWYNDRVFTDNPPADGGILEKRVGLISRGLANVVMQNLAAMHLKNGVLVSEWTPTEGTGDVLLMKDAALSMVALKEYDDRHEFLDEDEDLRDQAWEMLTALADFLVEVQGADGSFFERYDVTTGEGLGENTLSAPNWAGVRALVSAWQKTEDESYMEAARRTFNLLNREYWVEAHGLYRTRLGDDTVVLTPYDVGVALGAMREMIFATPLHLVAPQLDRLTRWWIQTMDSSGMQQAEDNRTGELACGTTGMDEDADGVPFVAGGYGKHGVAPVAAGKVAVNIGGADNAAFARIKGDRYEPEKYAQVKYGHEPQSSDEQPALLLPIEIPQEGLIERPPMQKFNGTIIPLPASKPIERGLGIKLGLSGREIFEMNCVLCHGFTGEGITGLSFKRDALTFSHDEMFKVPMEGRHEKLMPPWGQGNKDELGGVLTEEEIHLIVNYVQSEEFKEKFKAHEAGVFVADAPPKDPFEFLSRHYSTEGTRSATADDIRAIALSQPRASEFIVDTRVRFRRLLAEWRERQETQLAGRTGEE
ncbi:MAG: cytochrome c [Planctomycetes bacterium]|nr:cytochrome c [Planctomycetota bacterium]